MICNILDEVDALKDGAVLEILNARIEMFDKKYMRLKTSKWSKIVVSSEKLENVKNDNVSLVEYVAEDSSTSNGKE